MLNLRIKDVLTREVCLRDRRGTVGPETDNRDNLSNLLNNKHGKKTVGGERREVTQLMNPVFYFYGNRLASRAVAKGDSSCISKQ